MRRVVAMIVVALVSGLGAGPAAAVYDPLIVVTGNLVRDAGVTGDVSVRARPVPGSESTESRSGGGTGDTYTIRGLDWGTYDLEVESDAGDFVPFHTTAVIGPGGSDRLPTLHLSTGSPITGVLLDWLGKPVAGSHLHSLLVSTAYEQQAATTDANGRFSLAARPGARYRIYEGNLLSDQDNVAAGSSIVVRQHFAGPTKTTAKGASSTYGTSAVVVATVKATTVGSLPARNQIDVHEGSRELGWADVDAHGTARIKLVPTLAVGTHRVRVTYRPDRDGATSSTTVVVKVAKATPKAKVSVNKWTAKRGKRTKIGATFTAPTKVTGTITAYVGGHKVGTAKVRKSLGRYTAMVSTVVLRYSGRVTVRYSGSKTMKSLKLKTSYRVR